MSLETEESTTTTAVPEGVHTSKEYEPITWGALEAEYGWEEVAHGRVLNGVVSFVEEELWRRGISKVFLVQDGDGAERQVQFKAALAAEAAEELLALGVGAEVGLRSPRHHRFVDGETGTHVDDASDIDVKKRASDAMLSAARKLQLGEAMKARGNVWFKRGEKHRASSNYQAAVNLLNTVTVESVAASSSTADGDDDPLRVVEQAKILQSECASNLMLMALQEEKWRVVVETGEQILVNGLREGLRAKVLYRMALAMEKGGGSMLEALEYAQKAKEAALAQGQDVGDVVALCERLRAATSGRRELGGLRHLSWGQQYHLEGMLPRFGYRAPLVGSAEEAKALDQTKLIDARQLVPMLASHSAGSRKRLKPRLLYVSRLTTLRPPEVAHIETVLRVKTIIWLDAAAPRSVFSFLTGWRNKASLTQDAVTAKFSSLGCRVVDSSQAASHLEQPPADERVIIRVRLMPLLLPFWLYFAAAALMFVGLAFLARPIFRWHMRCQSRQHSCKAVRTGGGEEEVGGSPLPHAVQTSPAIRDLTARVLCDPSNYPALFWCSGGSLLCEAHEGRAVAYAACAGYLQAALDPGKDEGVVGTISSTKVEEKEEDAHSSFIINIKKARNFIFDR